MKTVSIKKEQIKRDWYIVDASNQKLGRLASNIAQIIRGKHKPFFTPNLDMGDFIVVINAEKVTLSGSNKEDQKEYWRHTGYPGGQKVISFKSMKEKYPERIIMSAVKGMLPHNRLGKKLLTHLKVYSGSTHPHLSQQPKSLEF